MSKWYDYLVVVYGGKDEPGRRSAYEAAFTDADAAVMLDVAKAIARASTFFPRISEVNGLLVQMQRARDEQGDTSWLLWARREKQRRAWGAEWLTWVDCTGGCGERYPAGLSECPFCADMVESAAETAVVGR